MSTEDLTPDERAKLVEEGIGIATKELRELKEQCADDLGKQYLHEAARKIEFKHLRKKARDERRVSMP